MNDQTFLFRSWTLAVLLFGVVSPVEASLIFQSTFNSYSNTTTNVGGLYGDIKNNNALKIEGVTGGTGGGLIQQGVNAGNNISILNSNPFPGGGGYLSIGALVNANNTPMAEFTPASAANSFAAMTPLVSGQRQINGGLDFFYRSDSAIDVGNEFRAIDLSSSGGIRLILVNSGTSNDLYLNLIGPAGTAFTSFSNIGNSTQGSGNNLRVGIDNTAFQMGANTVYHLGATFSTDGAGLVTARLFGAAGVGAIDTSASTDLLGAASFQIEEAVVTAGFSSGNIRFGTVNNLSSGGTRTQEFDLLRLYDQAPASFTSSIPEPSTMVLTGLFGLGGGLLRCCRRFC